MLESSVEEGDPDRYTAVGEINPHAMTGGNHVKDQCPSSSLEVKEPSVEAEHGNTCRHGMEVEVRAPRQGDRGKRMAASASALDGQRRRAAHANACTVAGPGLQGIPSEVTMGGGRVENLVVCEARDVSRWGLGQG